MKLCGLFLFLLINLPFCTKKADSESPILINKKVWDNEIIEDDSTFINGNLPIRCTAEDLKRLYGPPLKIRKIEKTSSLYINSWGASDFSIWEYEGMQFYKKDDYCLLRYFDFSDGRYILIGNAKISSQSKDNLLRIFPESAKVMEHFHKSSNFSYLEVNVMVDDPVKWVFKFYKNELYIMELYDLNNDLNI